VSSTIRGRKSLFQLSTLKVRERETEKERGDE